MRPAKDYLLFDCALSYGIVEYIRGFADGIPIADGYVGLPDAPGLGFEAKANLHRAFRALLD